MSQPKPISEAKNQSIVNVYAHEELELPSAPEVVTLPSPL